MCLAASSPRRTGCFGATRRMMHHASVKYTPNASELGPQCSERPKRQRADRMRYEGITRESLSPEQTHKMVRTYSTLSTSRRSTSYGVEMALRYETCPVRSKIMVVSSVRT